jgi:hypothetical protein
MTAEPFAIPTGRYTNVGDAIMAACNGFNPAGVVGWHNTHWIVYHPYVRPPADVVPEFLCFGNGWVPLPLSDDAALVWESLCRSLV